MAKYEPQTESQPGEKRCPKCRSPRIEQAGPAEVLVEGLKKPMRCGECKHTWSIVVPIGPSQDTMWGQ